MCHFPCRKLAYWFTLSAEICLANAKDKLQRAGDMFPDACSLVMDPYFTEAFLLPQNESVCVCSFSGEIQWR